MIDERVFLRHIVFEDGFELRPFRREFRELERGFFNHETHQIHEMNSDSFCFRVVRVFRGCSRLTFSSTKASGWWWSMFVPVGGEDALAARALEGNAEAANAAEEVYEA